MARWLLTLLALSAVAVAVVLAIARPGALSRPGTFAQPVAAVADAEPSVHALGLYRQDRERRRLVRPEPHRHHDHRVCRRLPPARPLRRQPARGRPQLPRQRSAMTAPSTSASTNRVSLSALVPRAPLERPASTTTPTPTPATTWPADVEGLGTGWTCSSLREGRIRRSTPSAASPSAPSRSWPCPSPARNSLDPLRGQRRLRTRREWGLGRPRRAHPQCHWRWHGQRQHQQSPG